MLCLLLLVGFPSVLGARVRQTALRSKKVDKTGAALHGYTFFQFIKDFDRSYEVGTAEYRKRSVLFQESLNHILALHSRNSQEGRPWTPGIHPFMDWTLEERQIMHGYKPSKRRHQAAVATAALQVGAAGQNRQKMNLSTFEDAYIGEGVMHRNQGNCGSCWAISSAEAVEAQLRKQGHDVQVSAQALVDCVPNPRHCGGTGGCDGATGELAYTFMQQYGIPLESDLPYRKSSTCGGGQQEPAASAMQSGASSYPAKQRVTLDGWDALPSNSADPLKQALVQVGAVVVAVDANNWFDYSHGIFDDCNKDATLGHAVLAKGYGKDDGESGTFKSYWLIQNSWSRGWGENGDIRLLRHDDDDDSWCGTDSEPQKGVGCDGGPSSVKVCGMCGVLFDSLVPKGVRIVNDDDAGSKARADAADYTPWKPDYSTWKAA